MKNKIFDEMIELLKKSEECNLKDIEIEKLAAIVCAVVNSDEMIRNLFYIGIDMISLDIIDILNKDKPSKILKNNNGNNTLN